MDNTVVVVTTDNGGGPWDSNTPLRGTKVLGDAFGDQISCNTWKRDYKQHQEYLHELGGVEEMLRSYWAAIDVHFCQEFLLLSEKFLLLTEYFPCQETLKLCFCLNIFRCPGNLVRGFLSIFFVARKPCMRVFCQYFSCPANLIRGFLSIFSLFVSFSLPRKPYTRVA